MTDKLKNDKNYVLLIGNVGRKPRFIKFQNGNEIATFSVGTNTETFRNADTGEMRSFTDWHMVAATKPEHVEIVRGLSEGDKVELAGSLRTRKYRKDGEAKDRYVTEVVIEKGLEILKKKEQSASEGEEAIAN